ncbi:MAG: ribosome recycling factor [Bacteroidales bacterium]|nr:ribosome recycling factor [Bacteroidales bacterium]
MEEIEMLLDDTKEQMQSALAFLEKELQKIRAGKANPQMLEGVKVDYYGTLTPLHQVSNIHTPDAKLIVVQAWEKNMLNPIEKAIQAANLGFNPINDGVIIRIPVPALTEERRRDLMKKVKTEVENIKIRIRNIRRDANEYAKKLEKDGIPEDMVKKLIDDIQSLTNSFIDKSDKIFDAKEKDIMSV